MVPIGALRWYRFERYDGTDSSATMVPFRRYYHYVVPECVRSIADFSANSFVESITVNQPVELTTIDTFAYNMNLRKIDFMGGVSGITKDTFYNCLKLKHRKRG